MSLRRIAPLIAPVFCVAALAGLSAADPVLPPTPAVPAKVGMPAKNFTQDIPGTDIKFDLVYVPGGDFQMGSPDDEPGRLPDEGPRHGVKVRPYWLGKFEVTWDEYYTFWKDESLFVAGEIPEEIKEKLGKDGPPADAITRPTNTFVDELYDHGRDGFPALCMSHHAAMMYCHWLRYKTKLPFRLPTEAEWEFACRAGQTGPYGFDPKDGKLDDFAWFKANSPDDDHPDGTTHKVGTKKPNAFGLHDMHGNVWEWCLDHFDPKFYAKFPADAFTLGPVNKPTDKKWGHTVRGGSWADKPDRLRSAARWGSEKPWMKYDPQIPQSIWWLTKKDVIGFRVALPVEEYPELVGLKPMVLKKAD
jgi:formylglycine-generating enzyme required for sulfatase activity